jgi:hypothetical protein
MAFFNVDNIKLGQLPGIFDAVKAEGGFFKLYADAWKNKAWEVADDAQIGCLGNETWQEYVDSHYHGWVHPGYTLLKTSHDEIACRILVVDSSKRDIAIGVVYDKKNLNVICWWINAD